MGAWCGYIPLWPPDVSIVAATDEKCLSIILLGSMAASISIV
jgi:hypothetical protein